MTCLKGIHILQALTLHLDHCLSVREIYTPHNESKKNLAPTYRPDVINVNMLHSLGADFINREDLYVGVYYKTKVISHRPNS